MEEISSTKSQETFLSQVQVAVTLELGAIALSIEDLVNLSKGNVIPLRCNPDSQVELLVGSERIATGVLVASEEGVFLKISRTYGV